MQVRHSWVGRSPGGGHGNPLRYSGLENLADRGAWRATFHGVTKSQPQLSDLAQMHAHTAPPGRCIHTNKYIHTQYTYFSKSSQTIQQSWGPSSQHTQ